ncbi:TVP38/TMEM64 family protein [Williamsia sp. CHRR-6]|uniref:TVP38/TMEM64 family protein n=1 Tax=Williamsia sp. CHRR-6 TaxID=2835871 RepID=UPI001BDA75BA|nr:TVP38/TMEM64 family protein [Williamsia sp. CHRR-6]MBT0566622.1 TVP38/TMEM64 family protein [Williamsia sp. CHRR-6]
MPVEAGTRRRVPILRVAVLVTAVIVVVIVAGTVDLGDADQLRARVAEFGAWGPVVFVLLYGGLSATPFPAGVLTIAAGLAFGLLGGVAVVMVGATIGAALAFGLARTVGRDLAVRLVGSPMARLDGFLDRRGFVSVLTVRLIPVFPFAIIGYAAGLSGISVRAYLVGTVLGMTPGVIGYTALGAYGTSPLSWPFAAAVVSVVLIALVTNRLASRWQRDGTLPAAAPSGDEVR